MGCSDDALKFPDYQSDFHVKGYRRVNLWSNEPPWTDTRLKVNSGDAVYFYGKGKLHGIPYEQQRNRLGTIVGDKKVPILSKKVEGIHNDSEAHFTILDIYSDGNLQLAVPDWDTYPPPNKNYEGNSGVLILDIFVIDPNQKEGFNRFKEALFEANPDDENVKAYLGKS